MVLVILGLLICSNTLNHEFTQDDAIVISENILTKKGMDGLKAIFTTDSFYGFFQEEGKSNLVSGGRYRPLSIAYFAILWEAFGDNTTVYHFSSVFWYLALCLLIFHTLMRLGQPGDQRLRWMMAMTTCLIFITHPVHSEVVANVKGHDEIFSMIWSVMSLWFAMKHVKGRQPLIFLGLSGIAYFLALLSKENAVVFLLLIPVVLWFYGENPRRKNVLSVFFALLAVFVIYLLIRIQIVGWHVGEESSELMNNPFIKVVDGQYLAFTSAERFSAVVLGLAKYLQLCFFPHPLTNDYYPRYFDVVQLTDPKVILALVMNLSLLAIAILGAAKRSFISFCILGFYASIFLTSNILFPIGTHLSERFLFLPSIFVSLLAGYAMIGHPLNTGKNG